MRVLLCEAASSLSASHLVSLSLQSIELPIHRYKCFWVNRGRATPLVCPQVAPPVDVDLSFEFDNVLVVL
jgi:hypothetical protein